MPATIDRLIINSPYEEPAQHWVYDREARSFDLKTGRRPAGYVVATPGSRSFDDPGIFHELPLVNQIRPRVKAWREAGYPGTTGITQRLLQHWNDPEERGDRRLFFCQLEAIETIIWLAEAPPAERAGIDVPGDGGEFARLCCKMATGSGKTVVMAMLVAWQVINKVTYPNDPRFSRSVLVIAPGLTVRNRLQVVDPSSAPNFYEEFQVIPLGLTEKLRQGKVRVRNWHALSWETDEQLARKRSVDKRGAKSDEAYVRDVLEDLASARNLLVINDEAHHAWRLPPGQSARGLGKEEIEEATKWVGGLDRIHRARGILRCYDFSATPFAPTGHAAAGESLFPWIVSDFGLNDAIESGLVKTPRVVIRDDGRLTPQAPLPPLPHLHGQRGEERPEPQGRGARPAPFAREHGLPVAGEGLAGGQAAMGGRRPADTARHDHRGQPHRNGGAGQVRLRWRPDRDHGAARPGADPPHRLQSFGEGRGARGGRASAGGRSLRGRRGGPRAGARSQADRGRAAPTHGGHGGEARSAGRPHPERNLGRHALRGLGRTHGDPHHGAAGVHQPASVRAGRRPRAAAHLVRGGLGDRALRARIREHLRGALHIPAP